MQAEECYTHRPFLEASIAISDIQPTCIYVCGRACSSSCCSPWRNTRRSQHGHGHDVSHRHTDSRQFSRWSNQRARQLEPVSLCLQRYAFVATRRPPTSGSSQCVLTSPQCPAASDAAVIMPCRYDDNGGCTPDVSLVPALAIEPEVVSDTSGPVTRLRCLHSLMVVADVGYLLRTVVGVAGEDYVIIAASTRMSTSFSILTRHASKFVQMCAFNHQCAIAVLPSRPYTDPASYTSCCTACCVPDQTAEVRAPVEKHYEFP